jgi:hypothetical protein
LGDGFYSLPRAQERGTVDVQPNKQHPNIVPDFVRDTALDTEAVEQRKRNLVCFRSVSLIMVSHGLIGPSGGAGAAP